MKKEDYYNFGKFISLIIIVWLVWYLGWLWLDTLEPDPLKRGTFGDKFGFINSLFSAFALAGIVYSILLQQKELNLQRQELSDTREEFKDQNFQTTFFNLLNTQRQIANEISITIWNLKSYDKEFGSEYNGRKFFNQSKAEISRIIEALKQDKYGSYSPWEDPDGEYSPNSYEEAEYLANSRNLAFTSSYYEIDKESWELSKDKIPSDLGKLAYSFFYNKFSYASGHYFRHLYHILNFLQNAEIEKIKNASNKAKPEINLEFKQFANFVQAQMSTPELFLVFYNSLLFPKLQLLLIKYNILENFPKEDLIDSKHQIENIILKSKNDIINSV